MRDAFRKYQINNYNMLENKKRVYRFGGKKAEGNGTMRELLGGKGANLAEMNLLGMPVPAGFTITTECCAEYYALGGGYSDALKEEVKAAMAATDPRNSRVHAPVKIKGPLAFQLWSAAGFFLLHEVCQGR